MIKPDFIQFVIEKEKKGYFAKAVFFPIFTEGKTLDEISKNIKEAVECYFDVENRYFNINM